MPIKISTSLDGLADRITKASVITIGDALFVANHIDQTIHQSTAQGIDFEDSPFKPYNETDPYYYYPFAGQGHNHEHIQRELGRLHKQLGGQRTKTGIKFVSYGAFKRSLGAAVVNLYGPADPHMLDAFEVRVNGVVFKLGSYDNPAPASVVTLGIYNEKGRLAAIHNEGLGRQPERRFFELSQRAADRIIFDIQTRIAERLSKI